jgi:cytochrome c biogenesis protein CcmG, thiol:disulfide interchange protein DsbE
MTVRLKLGAQAIAVGLVLALLALLIWKVAFKNDSGGIAQRIDHGKIVNAPGFALRRLDAPGQLELASLRGRPVVLNFWASWCYPCNQEASTLEQAARQWSGKATVVGVDVRDASAEARKFLRKHDISYPVVHDNHDSMWPKWGLTGLPETFFVDPRGRVVGHVSGQITAATLRTGIEEALKA